MKIKLQLLVAAAFIAIASVQNTTIKAQITTQTFSYTGSLQNFTVPLLCVNTITIEARGASGASVSTNCSASGGFGARMIGEFTVSPGQVLTILVGGVGQSNTSDAGGGGGSFVVMQGTVPLIVAGGGGGASNNIGQCGSNLNGINASITTSATASANNLVAGGVNGGGGGASTGSGGGGGGFYTDGTPGAGNANSAGKSFLNAAAGGTGNNNDGGGYGGGGAGWFTGGNGGGGGGYSGGGTSGSQPFTGGGGGGSYNAGTNQNNTAGVQLGNGLVVITYNVGTPITVSANPFAVCSGSSAVLSASGMVTYTWSTGAQTSSITVSPAVSTAYTVQGTNSQNCISTAVLNVTVSNGTPVLAVTSSTNSLCLGKTATLTASGALSYTWSHNVTNGVSFVPSATAVYTVTGANGCGTSSAVTSITVAPLALTLSNSPTITCSGKPSTLTAVSPATGFTWQPYGLTGTLVVVNPTVSTVFTVTATDGTCSGIQSINLNVLPIPTINVVASNTSVCAGEPVMLSASGGINYTWSPGNLSGPSVTVNPTGATLYTVSGDNSVGCSSSTTQIVLTISSPTVNVSATPSFVCAGDNVLLFASGSSAGYQWTGGPSTSSYQVSPMVTTVYTVTGSQQTNTCTTTKTVAVTVFAPVLTVVSSATAVCGGHSVMITATGADQYFWTHDNSTSNVATDFPVSGTIYTVSGSTSSNNISCPITKTIAVGVYPNPTVTASSTRTFICQGESTSLNASGAQTYSWSNNLTANSITVNPVQITIHTYTVTGFSSEGCSANTTILIRVSLCNGISELKQDTDNFIVYPNPAHGEITLTAISELQVTLYNELGQKISVCEFNSDNNYTITLKLQPGIYFLTDQSLFGNGKKIVID